MGWQDNLRPASFRGVSFYVSTSNHSGGRKLVSHEFPHRDLPYDEDLGRATRQFRVDAYVIGDDYMSQRDRLLDALEMAGQGELIHPYFGRRLVTCHRFDVLESSSEGRKASFSIDFAETEESPVRVLVQIPELSDAVTTASESTQESLEASFVAGFSIADMPAFFRDHAQNLIEKVSDKINLGKGLLKSTTTEVTQIKATWDKAVTDLKLEAAALVSNVTELADKVLDIFDTAQNVTTTASEVFDFYKSLLDFGDDEPAISETTSTRAQQAKNQEKLIELVKVATLANAAEAATDKEYETYSDAIADRNLLIDEIEAILDITDDDDIFRDLINLKASIIQALPDDTENLPRIISYTPGQTLPSVVVAYDLYEDALVDIAIRNQIAHPGFLPGGQALEVLSDV